MRIATALALALTACSTAEPEWFEEAVQVDVRACGALPEAEAPTSDVAIWYADGFGLQFDDRAVSDAVACWTYDADTQTADLMLSASVVEIVGTTTTLYVDATSMMRIHAETHPDDALTFKRGDDVFQTVDQDWSDWAPE